MELTQTIRSSSLQIQDARSAFGPEASSALSYQPLAETAEGEVSAWVEGLWDRRVSRLKDSRWNTRWAGLRP